MSIPRYATYFSLDLNYSNIVTKQLKLA
jgi:hypothetical protein